MVGEVFSADIPAHQCINLAAAERPQALPCGEHFALGGHRVPLAGLVDVAGDAFAALREQSHLILGVGVAALCGFGVPVGGAGRIGVGVLALFGDGYLGSNIAGFGRRGAPLSGLLQVSVGFV